MTHKHRKQIVKWGGIVLLVFISTAGVLVGSLLIIHNQPVVLPVPAGQDGVGRVEYDWSDVQRIDPLSDTPNQVRRLPIWIWYPATVNAQSVSAPYRPTPWKDAQNKSSSILQTLSTRSDTKTHSYANIPLASANAPYPVIVMQPGLGPSIPDYTVFAENLASHGYIVVGINEPYSSTLVVYADGQVARATAKGSISDTASATTTDEQTNMIGQVWRDDAIFVINHLQAVANDETSLFYHQLDLDHIGFFGHSFGGASAIAVCQSDSRCKAGADLDGTPLSAGATLPIQQPFLFLSEGFAKGCSQDKNCQPLQQSYDQTTNRAYFISIKGAKHFNFSDIALHFTFLGQFIFQQMGQIGSIDPAHGLAIANAYLVAFFDKYLKGIDSPLLTSLRPYSEVQFTSK